ncbi:MAG: hypothetical protein LH631_01250 [Alkalinema sp. CAN_BIN05]|nr:hypothetical protein [Alkalinema sp. CAN_BIN05]
MNGKQFELKLDPEVALTIENDERQPYREHKKNLQEYEACLVEELEFKFPLGDRAKTELQDYWKKELKLTADEVEAIEDRVIAAFAITHPVVEPIVPPIPTPESIAQPEPPPKPKLPTFAFEVVTVDVTGKEIACKPGSATYFNVSFG